MSVVVDYRAELAGLVALPDMMAGNLLGFARRIGVLLREEQEKPLPNNALIVLLCDAARLGDEYLLAMVREVGDEGRCVVCGCSDNSPYLDTAGAVCCSWSAREDVMCSRCKRLLHAAEVAAVERFKKTLEVAHAGAG